MLVEFDQPRTLVEGVSPGHHRSSFIRLIFWLVCLRGTTEYIAWIHPAKSVEEDPQAKTVPRY